MQTFASPVNRAVGPPHKPDWAHGDNKGEVQS